MGACQCLTSSFFNLPEASFPNQAHVFWGCDWSGNFGWVSSYVMVLVTLRMTDGIQNTHR